MSRGAIPLLLALAAGLAGLIALELRPDSGDDGAMPAHPAPLMAAPLLAVLPGQAPSANRQAWVEAVLARPLFSPGRRPPPPGAAAPGAAPAALPRLSGILMDGGSRRAIFAGATDGARPTVVAEGAEISGFRVQSIEAAQVTMLGPDGPRVLRPSFDPRPPAPAAAPAPPPGIPGLPNLQSLTGIPGLNLPPAR